MKSLPVTGRLFLLGFVTRIPDQANTAEEKDYRNDGDNNKWLHIFTILDKHVTTVN